MSSCKEKDTLVLSMGEEPKAVQMEKIINKKFLTFPLDSICQEGTNTTRFTFLLVVIFSITPFREERFITSRTN